MAGARGVIKWAGVRSRCSERAHPRLIGAGRRHPADAGAASEINAPAKPVETPPRRPWTRVRFPPPPPILSPPHACGRALVIRPWWGFTLMGWIVQTAFFLGPAVLVVAVISVVGLLVVIPYVLFALLAYLFVTTAVAAFVAQRVLTGSGQNDNLMLATTLGVIGTTIVSRIPVLDRLVVIAMIVFGTGTGTGTGTAALAIVEWRQARKLAGAPPAET